MAISAQKFAAQNWLITPAALALNEPKPGTISDQSWLVTLTGVCIIDLKGTSANDWRREIVLIFPDINAPMQFAINKYSIPKPAGINVRPALNLEEWAEFAAISAIFEKDSGATDAGFGIDAWRLNPFFSGTAVGGKPARQVFTGIQADAVVRNNKATLHRVSYHITLLGKIVFFEHNI
jgi:hypothetical protein